MIRAEGFIPRRLRRNKGEETRQQLPYENNIPRCLRRGMLIPFLYGQKITLSTIREDCNIRRSPRGFRLAPK